MGVIKNKIHYTEELIQKRLSNNFMSPNSIKFLAENLYIYGWESDLWLMTKSDVTYEFEIKISKADFKNDFKHKTKKHQLFEEKYKNKEIYTPGYYELLDRYKKRNINEDIYLFEKYVEEHPSQFKYDEIMLPTYFYYAVPEDMIKEDDVPEYAGLIYMLNYYPYHKIIKQAPKLTNKKNTIEGLNLTEKFYYNYRDWRLKACDEKENTNKVKELLNEVADKPDEEKISYIDLKKKYEKEKEKYEYWYECWKNKQKEVDYLDKICKENSHYIRKLIRLLQENKIDYKHIDDEE